MGQEETIQLSLATHDCVIILITGFFHIHKTIDSNSLVSGDLYWAHFAWNHRWIYFYLSPQVDSWIISLSLKSILENYPWIHKFYVSSDNFLFSWVRISTNPVTISLYISYVHPLSKENLPSKIDKLSKDNSGVDPWLGMRSSSVRCASLASSRSVRARELSLPSCRHRVTSFSSLTHSLT